MDNEDGILKGKQDSWLGNGQDITRAGHWMTSPSTRSVNGEDGLDGK